MTNKMITAALAATIALALTGCKQKNPADQVRKTDLPKAGQNAPAANGGVAIVDIDSLANKYTYCVEGQKQLQAKEAGYRQQLNAKMQALQRAGMEFQNKAQSGGFTSQQQAQAAQAALQRQQQALQSYQQKVEADMAKATQSYQTVLRDSLKNFLKDYNADGRFKVIISKSGDNVLYAAPGTDITDEVIAGLNKRYKK